jgi:hypothetical protein
MVRQTGFEPAAYGFEENYYDFFPFYSPYPGGRSESSST